jgi:hypothetical protein
MENLEQLQNFVQFSSEHTMPSGVRWGFGLELLTAFITFGSIMRNSIIKMQFFFHKFKMKFVWGGTI